MICSRSFRADGLYDLYDLYDLAHHVARWEPHNLRGLQHDSGLDLYSEQILCTTRYPLHHLITVGQDLDHDLSVGDLSVDGLSVHGLSDVRNISSDRGPV